ncbi:hypothetical protein SLEP1_g20789 [Rubroshorea leprosula]|uniref:Uncharacterized protein n=1 Tax=Rubroshorea leprosula TaxID=152421 RepID=A0AAV5J3U1_9ROSI|nr:hypothetical protein SLEP1_g20789 [Rubroshorea leprosula]
MCGSRCKSSGQAFECKVLSGKANSDRNSLLDLGVR